MEFSKEDVDAVSDPALVVPRSSTDGPLDVWYMSSSGQNSGSQSLAAASETHHETVSLGQVATEEGFRPDVAHAHACHGDPHRKHVKFGVWLVGESRSDVPAFDAPGHHRVLARRPRYQWLCLLSPRRFGSDQDRQLGCKSGRHDRLVPFSPPSS